MIAVTFDAGQTLVDLDPLLLAARVAERGARIDPQAVDAALPAAWRAYGDAKRRGLAGRDVWWTFMRDLLGGAAVEAGDPAELAAWLWTEQPRTNLWRRPVSGMIEVVRDVAKSGVPVGLLSNSEGRLAELVAELGWAEDFAVVADSGVLGVEKPDPRIFEWIAERLAVPVGALVHVGDAWETDIVGALGVGASAIWFGPSDARPLPRSVTVARDAHELRTALRGHGVVLP